MSVSMIMRSTKLTVISRMSCLNRDSRISDREERERQRRGDSRAAQQHQQAEIDQAPGEHERSRGNELAFGRNQDRERREVQRNEQRHAQWSAATPWRPERRLVERQWRAAWTNGRTRTL